MLGLLTLAHRNGFPPRKPPTLEGPAPGTRRMNWRISMSHSKAHLRIAFYGDIYTGTPSLAFNVSIDGKPAIQSSVTSAAGFLGVPSYFPFWQSSVIGLASGDDRHTIDITQLPYIGLYFILVTPVCRSLADIQGSATPRPTECDSSTLIVDYIAYEPSFSSWSTIPNISLPSLGSQGSTALPGATTTPVTTSGSKKTPVGAIAGGVVGAWVLLTLLGLFLFWRRKHQRKENPSAFTDQRDPGSFLREKDVPPGQEAYTVSHPAYIATSNEAEVGASKSSPKSVYSEKGSVTLSYRPFSLASIDSSSSVAAGGSSSPAQDRHRIMELEKLLEESEAKEDEESPALTQMKERIQMLTQENERLASLAEAPPSYIASDSGVSSAAGDVKGNNSVLKEMEPDDAGRLVADASSYSSPSPSSVSKGLGTVSCDVYISSSSAGGAVIFLNLDSAEQGAFDSLVRRDLAE
ncbi:hypothetical protein C8J56DRAFT_1165462 [Mycena floridula]|nr:hypothetical protein C8J56DRAFT_1165462 [Mycena floridula]